MDNKRNTISNIEFLLPAIYRSIILGFNDCYHNDQIDQLRYRPSTKASIVYDNIVANLKKELALHPSVKFITQKGLITLSIKDKFLIRIKKLDDNHRSSNIRTKQSTLFVNQQSLFENEDALTNLEIGYVLEPIENSIRGIWVVCPKNEKNNNWELDLDAYFSNQPQSDIFDQFKPTAEPLAPKKPRYIIPKLKKEIN